MKRHIILYIFTVLLLASCGDDNNVFVIKGQLNNLGGRPLYAVYKVDDMITVDTLRPDDGYIEMRGSSAEYTPVQLYDVTMQPFMRFYLRNGEKVEMEGDATNMYEIEIKSTPINKELWRLICEHNELFTAVDVERMRNARSEINIPIYTAEQQQLDSIFIDYIIEHRNSLLSSALLGDYLLNYNNFALCDSLWNLLDEEARLPHVAHTIEHLGTELVVNADNKKLPHLRFYNNEDSLIYINPNHSRATLLYIWATTDAFSTANRKQLDKLAQKYDTEQLQIVTLSIDTDTAQWLKYLVNDTLPISHLWCEGFFNNKSMKDHHVTRLPVIMLGDSLGNIIVRTNRLPDGDVSAQIDSLINNSNYTPDTLIYKF